MRLASLWHSPGQRSHRAVVIAALAMVPAAMALVRPGPLDAKESISFPAVTGRTLFVTARDDPYADGSPRLVTIRARYERTPAPKELLILDGTAHAFIFGTDQGERFMTEILRFLSAP